jgi:hypothetical protein
MAPRDYGSIPPTEDGNETGKHDIGNLNIITPLLREEKTKHRRFRSLPVLCCSALAALLVGIMLLTPRRDDTGGGGNSEDRTPPLSMLSPDKEMGLQAVNRADDASPSSIWGKKAKDGRPLPTNSWYLVSEKTPRLCK